MVLATLVAAFGCRERSPDTSARAPATAPATRARAATPKAPGLPAPPADPALVESARSFLAPPVVPESCGPYRVLTDLDGPRRAATLAACRALAATLDEEYRRRIGLPLAGPAAGTIVRFADRRRYREYQAAGAAGSGPALPTGYAGFSLPWAGLVVLPVADLHGEEIASTLGHELAHLAHRRAFGRDLPPWLAEGLADALGDGATPNGFAPLDDRSVVAGIEKRLRGGYELDRVGSLERLVALDGDGFDRGTVSYDYEQSALLVRFLLLDRELATRFRGWLAALADRGPRDSPTLPTALEIPWSELEARFAAWLDRDSTSSIR